MGHHCHDRKRLSGGRPKSFCLLLGKKFCGMCISPLAGGDGCGCLCPRRQGLKQVYAPDTTTGRDPPQRRRARARKALRLTSRRPFAGMPGAQATGDRGGATGTVAASPGFSRIGRSDSPKPRQRVRRRLAGAPALPVGVGPDDRMPPGSREPKGARQTGQHCSSQNQSRKKKR